MMKFDQKWVKTLGLALSLPGTIFISALGTMELVKLGLISRTVAIILFLLIVGNTIFLMVYYGFKNKD